MEDIATLDFNRNSTYKKLEQYSVHLCKGISYLLLSSQMCLCCMHVSTFDMLLLLLDVNRKRNIDCVQRHYTALVIDGTVSSPKQSRILYVSPRTQQLFVASRFYQLRNGSHRFSNSFTCITIQYFIITLSSQAVPPLFTRT